jgi:hypothetical protein
VKNASWPSAYLSLLLLAFPADAATTIPFDLVDNRVMIEVTLNGHGPFRLLLDTGASGLVVREEVAAALRMPRFGTHEESGVGEATVQSHESRFESVDIAGLSLGSQDCTIIAFDDTPAVWGRERFDGIIGLPVFERWVVRIDYAARAVTFSEPKAFKRQANAVKIRLKRPNQIPLAIATIDGLSGSFGIDTGARSSLILSSPFIDAHHLRDRYRTSFETITGWGIGGPVRSQLARVRAMTLGQKLTMRGIVARLSTQTRGSLASTSMDGLIGGDVLRRFAVTFDYSRSMMLLEPNQRFKKEDDWDGTGMWIGQHGDAFEVLDIVPGGPAALAGVKKGDAIVAIDGRPTRSLSLPVERLALYYHGQPRTVRLTIRADGGERTVRVVMKALV